MQAETLICADKACNQSVKVIQSTDPEVSNHKGHQTISLKYLQQQLQQSDHPMAQLMSLEKPSQLIETVTVLARESITLMASRINDMLATLINNILEQYDEIQFLRNVCVSVRDGKLDKLLVQQRTLVTVLADTHATEKRLSTYQDNLSTLQGTFSARLQAIQSMLHGNSFRHLEEEQMTWNTTIQPESIDIDIAKPKPAMVVPSYHINKLYYKNDRMDEQVVLAQLKELPSVDIIDIDLGGLFEKKCLSHINEILSTIFAFQMLEELTLCLMQTNISDMREIALGLGKVPHLSQLHLNLSHTNVSDVSFLAIGIGQMERIVTLSLNFRDTPVQQVEEFQKPLQRVHTIQEFTINLCGTKVPQRLCCFFGCVSGFLSQLERVYGRRA